MSKVFKVTATMDVGYQLFIKAENEEDAMEKAKDGRKKYCQELSLAAVSDISYETPKTSQTDSALWKLR